MATSTYETELRTPLHPPAAGWDGPMPRDKRLWMWVLWVTAILTLSISLIWFFVGHQQTPAAHYAVTPELFQQQVQDFVSKYETEPGSGVVEVPPGQDAYLLNRMWSIYPVLKLKAGETYRIWYSSVDVVHNPIIAGENLSFTAVPGHAYGITITPDKPGTYLVYCAEYCGLGHQNMAGQLIVE